MEPSVLNPHVKTNPEVTVEKRLRGGVAGPRPVLPQQVSDPSSLTPQVCWAAAEIEVNEPAGGDDCPWLLIPQQTTPPLVSIPQEWAKPALTDLNSADSACLSAVSPPSESGEVGVSVIVGEETGVAGTSSRTSSLPPQAATDMAKRTTDRASMAGIQGLAMLFTGSPHDLNLTTYSATVRSQHRSKQLPNALAI